MVEWSITTVLKTVVPRGTGGSNPSLSATNAENQQIAKQTPSFTPKFVIVFQRQEWIIIQVFCVDRISFCLMYESTYL